MSGKPHKQGDEHPQVPPGWLPVGIGIAAAGLLTFGLLLRYFLLRDWSIGKSLFSAGSCAVLIVGAAGCVWLLGLQSRRGRRCLKCNYSLSDLDPDAPCPECGVGRWSEYNVQETMDEDSIRKLLDEREKALSELLTRLPGRTIVRVVYSDGQFEPRIQTLRELHTIEGGVELTLDDHTVIRAKVASPPCWFLSLGRGEIDYPKRDVTSHEAWTPFLNIPIAGVRVQRHALPMDLLQEYTFEVMVPIDIFLTFQNGEVLLFAAREYELGPPEATFPAGDTTVVIFGSARATELGFRPPEDV